MLKLAWRRPQATAPTSAPLDVLATLIADHLADHGELRWRARGRSMTPAIRHDQLVRLRRAVDVQVGDVVLARPAGMEAMVLHRVRAVEVHGLVLRGDACRLPDPPVARTDVLAIADPCPRESRVAPLFRWLP